jgi:hypothetical protein
MTYATWHLMQLLPCQIYFGLNVLKIGTKHTSQQGLRMINTLCLGADALYFLGNKMFIDFSFTKPVMQVWIEFSSTSTLNYTAKIIFTSLLQAHVQNNSSPKQFINIICVMSNDSDATKRRGNKNVRFSYFHPHRALVFKQRHGFGKLQSSGPKVVLCLS